MIDAEREPALLVATLNIILYESDAEPSCVLWQFEHILLSW
jgi:hypothetical protein